jgi:uncharacterized protein
VPPSWLRPVPGGVELVLTVQPRASRTRIVGEHGDCLRVQLAAPPVDGEANAALVSLLAKQLGIAKRQVRLLSGDTARRKRVLLEGVEPARAEAVMTQGE